MAKTPTAKDTIAWTDDYTQATITKAVSQKYAHKLLQDFFKTKTGIKGYWTFYHDYTDENCHHYTIDQPLIYLINRESK